jgi:succinyl-diaminopimelate desuccinylase
MSAPAAGRTGNDGAGGDPVRALLLARLAAEREALIALLQRLLRARSANPPGDTTAAAACLTAFLDAQGAPWRIAAAQRHMPNIVASFAGARPGRHLVLNGHIDVFPPFDESGWSGDRRDGRIYGRGAVDMKTGMLAGTVAYAWLHRVRADLRGRLTLTAVSDEESGGRWGTRWLFETMRDEVLGDCCLNGEPSGLNNIRFMEKGTLRMAVTVRAPGGHGGYPHLSRNPNKVMAALIAEFDRHFHLRETVLPEAVARALTSPEAVAVLEAGLGAGAADIVRRMTFNPGLVRGGLKVNQIPHEAVAEFDLRIPVGIDRDAVLAEAREICAAQDATLEVIEAHSYPGSMADPKHEMVRIIADNAEATTGVRPVAMSSLGGSDSRYWRYEGVPAYLYGPSPVSMGRGDEHVTEEEFLAIVRVHLLSAYDYLQASPG